MYKKPAHPTKIHRTIENNVLPILWFQPKKFYSFSRRCQFKKKKKKKKIPQLHFGGNHNKSPFQEDVPITIE